jgi:hypothetical protein
VQPAGQRVGLAYRSGLSSEDEEGGLEGVLGVGLVAQDAAADVQDHRAVPPQEGRESRLVPLAEEPPEQFLVAGAPHPRFSTDSADKL